MLVTGTRVEAPVERVEVSAFTVPTEAPESDGTATLKRADAARYA